MSNNPSESYDGLTSLGKAIANLLNFSPKNQTKIAEKIREAKLVLGIPIVLGQQGKKPAHLTKEQKMEIWSWLRLCRGYACDDGIYHHPDGSIEYVKDDIHFHTEPDGSGELSTQWGSAEYLATKELPNSFIEPDENQDIETLELDNFKRIAFYTIENGERTRKVIAIEHHYLSALTLLARDSKKTVPEWLEEISDGWEKKKITKSLTRFIRHEIFKHHRMY
jgi:hypothetical protein